MKTTTSLVTGGAGFIGSNLVDALLDRGDRVVIVDNLTTGRRENLDRAIGLGADLIEKDIRDSGAMLGIFERHRPSTVFHLAAQIDVRLSVSEPGFDATVNIAGTVNLLEANRATGNARFMLSSTGGAIYGEGAGQKLPLSEETPARPLSPYGQSKLAAEGYLSLYRELHGSNCAALRLGNVYGPRQDPLGEAGVIAIFCGALANGSRPTVYGNGRQTRDYIHVADVVEAMLAAGRSDAVGPLNIGTGIETSVLDLVEALAGLSSDANFRPLFDPPRTGEVQQISLDTSRARSELDWSAEVGLARGLKQTLASVDVTS